MKTKSFKMVTGNVNESFDREINRLLGLGWKLHGAPFATSIGMIAQAMIQKETAEEVMESWYTSKSTSESTVEDKSMGMTRVPFVPERI
jgi:hypothetical protein